MTNPVVALHYLRQHAQKRHPIFIILVNRFVPITSGGDVIQGTSKPIRRGSAIFGV
ncbi:MAG: hypothetical protein GY753_16490 [Gammaproteobacteria bacterium]|nr:hypothetical protein [Gammaproteobacteria bacterium]